MARVSLCGVPLDALTRSEVLDRCAAFLRNSHLHTIITANPELLLAARADQGVRQVVGQGSLVVPDGVGLLWAARRAGHHLPERIPGVELLVDLCRRAAKTQASVYLLGGRPHVAEALRGRPHVAEALRGRPHVAEALRGKGVAELTADRLRAEIPGLRVEAFPFDHEAERPPETLWRALERTRPAVLFVAYGQPRQELWMHAHRARLEAAGVRIAMGVGGAFDMLAGRLPRAPRWMRAFGLEWLWRLLWETARVPRTLRAVIVFPFLILTGRENPR